MSVNRSRYGSSTSFIDLCLNMIGILAIVLGLVLPLISIVKLKESQSPAKADVMIVVEWDNKFDDDVDVWVRDPVDNVLNFRNKNIGLMYLDRDDLGNSTNNVILPDGTTKQMPTHREIVTFRGIIPGQYLLNLQMYTKKSIEPTRVKVTCVKLNPSYEEFYVKEVDIQNKGDEIPVVSFFISDNGSVTSIDQEGELFIAKNFMGQQ